ncbi:hypothetical protein DICPUDRAFT_42465 [Dictyostelium purpureum]|uniref:DUF1990 domain-containing protein n=1 Tax=Dictyostelium purpureum TaxID=5786 RepID=F1A250_DICPU|nr:uncharacterized protein DICPUDRAFT_42465 [Dictyostelium purpureum]EGC29730.1 hypothetical protein DICPUDRAFT_42465 [Dictyostelium purpureum]|eukprot:XP_003293741.1 hypothetical protein DICPUDRAFT_42465 [Dictyostelium purpureum]
MFSIRRPSESDIKQYISDRREEQFQYSNLYGTQDYAEKHEYELDPKYSQFDVDQVKVKLGTGQECFQKAVEALKKWKQFDLGWVHLYFNNTPIAVGETVGVLSRQFGFWILSFCRINFVYDGSQEDGSVKYGFSYGTLKDHVERGEERFVIEWVRDPDSSLDKGDVYFEMLSFSEPNYWLSQLGYPVTRYFQSRFSIDACNSMLRSVGAPGVVKNI